MSPSLGISATKVPRCSCLKKKCVFFLLFCALVKLFKGLLYLLLNSQIMIALVAIFAVLETYR